MEDLFIEYNEEETARQYEEAVRDATNGYLDAVALECKERVVSFPTKEQLYMDMSISGLVDWAIGELIECGYEEDAANEIADSYGLVCDIVAEEIDNYYRENGIQPY